MARILIVEDEFLIFEDVKNKVDRLGHTVVAHATTGEAAIEYALQTKPELVLMDVRLRGNMNGIEAARLIRERHLVPLIYVTAQAKAVQRDLNAERQEFVLMKPFSLAQLEAVIVTALEPIY
jgi:two-component system, cell cycle sensor histidine kinase and response regulator CckA